jgi:hypothetical protein
MRILNVDKRVSADNELISPWISGTKSLTCRIKVEGKSSVRRHPSIPDVEAANVESDDRGETALCALCSSSKGGFALESA